MSSAAHVALHGKGVRLTVVSCGHVLGCGCENISYCCCKCPLSICRLERKGGVKAVLAIPRNKEIVKLRSIGKSVTVLSRQFKLSPMQIRRIVAKDAA